MTAKETDRNSVQLNLRTEKGKMQTRRLPDGKTEQFSPAGHVLAHFLNLDPLSRAEQWQIDADLRDTDEALTGFGVKRSGGTYDYDDFVGKTARVQVKPRVGSDGEPRDQVVRIRPL
jgi:hypothetical protein